MRRSVALLGLTLAMSLLHVTANAHEMRPAYLELRQTGDETYDVLWKVPARGRSMRLGLYARLPVGTENLSEPRAMFADGAYIERWSVEHAEGLIGKTIHIDGLQSTLTDVLVRIGRLDGSTQIVRLNPATPFFVIEASPSTLGVAKTYFQLGVQHIWKGIDHLLFVACLIMIAGTWKRIVITITGFTIAHSITLALAALNVVRVPIAPVEACIALSIVFLATEIGRERRDTFTWRYPITVSASFGLLHGFGFASALGEIGLPQTEIPAALLFFNVGVEVGQILFVLGVIVVVQVLRRCLIDRMFSPLSSVRLQPKVALSCAYLVGSLAAFWMIQRMHGFWG